MLLTIQDIIDELQSAAKPIENTVDVLIGPLAPDTPVTGIATTFMPTRKVIEQAAALGVNFLIAHEGAYFSHRTDYSLLAGDSVYERKNSLIHHSGVAIYRHHDYCHRADPDPIMAGLLESLNWESYLEEMLPTAAVLQIPAMKTDEVAAYAKSQLGIPYVRMAGDPDITCQRVGVLVGYRGGGANAIPLFREKELDLIIAGEGPEWETPEYARDAAGLGMVKSLLVLGHAESEEPGMRYLAVQLQRKYPELPVHFIPGRPVFQVY